MANRTIITSHINPPIPVRQFDWCAFYDGEEEAGNYGYGATEQDAIDDFVENYAEEREEQDAQQRERDAEALHNGGLSPLGNAVVQCTACFGTGQIDGGSDQGDTWACIACEGGAS